MCLALLAGSSHGQEPRDIVYRVEFAPSGDEALDAAARAVSQLERLRESSPTNDAGLVARAEGDADRLITALRSEGYWAGTARVTLLGETPDSPTLPDRVEQSSGELAVTITLTPGPRYTLGSIRVTGPGADIATATPFGIAEGDPARAAPVLDAGDTLRGRLRDAGYPLARLVSRDTVVDHDRHSMDVTYVVDAGPLAHFAQPRVTGAETVNTALLERVAERRLRGETYGPARLESARTAINALGPFSTVRAREGAELDGDGRLPVTFEVSERPLRLIGGSLGYETNYGPTARLYWEHRNIFGSAERLRLEGEVARLGDAGGFQDATYRLSATLRTPEVLRRDIQSVSTIQAVREQLDAYDRNAIVVSTLFEHRLGPHLVGQAGPSFETGEVGRDGDMLSFSLLGFTVGARWDYTTSLLDPRSGWRAAITATPYLSLGEGRSFTRVLATGSTYFDLSGNGGTVLALRAALGSAFGAGRDEITLDKRFYAGGGGSVRGYSYQAIGPRDAGNRPLGGASLVEGSIELRQRISGNLGMVAFLDAGSVGDSATPNFSDVHVGVGIGVRYATAIGPIRVDIATPLTRIRGESSYGLYVGIGQAF
ncbi:MAG TPA: autotransporter assembly complex family protein [Roseomonas sp.]